MVQEKGAEVMTAPPPGIHYSSARAEGDRWDTDSYSNGSSMPNG